MTKTPNAWIAIDHGIGTDHRLEPYILVLKGERSLYQAIEEDDWVLVLNSAGGITRVGRVLRVRSDLDDHHALFRPSAVGHRTPSRSATPRSRCRLRGVSVESSGPISSTR